jgi:hypothetical protein
MNKKEFTTKKASIIQQITHNTEFFESRLNDSDMNKEKRHYYMGKIDGLRIALDVIKNLL